MILQLSRLVVSAWPSQPILLLCVRCFFPGGCIGDLAVNGTVNDIAMSGATPLFLSAGFIIEEGLPLSTLGAVVERMAQATQEAGVTLITGDTKVVDIGHGDGLFINTTGIGLIPPGINIGPDKAQPGDVVIVSGSIGDHGMAIMSIREGLEFDTIIQSDSAPFKQSRRGDAGCHTPTSMCCVTPTRGGVASALNEIAQLSGVGIVLDEPKLPVKRAVRSACEMLGMDPLYVANEGKLLAIVPSQHSDVVLHAMRAYPLGKRATIIGEVVEQHSRMLVARTGIGGTRVVDMQVGEQLPRIC